PERCAKFAALALPELVRLHNNRRRDAYISRSVVREAPYLALDGGKYLLLRALVFRAALPEWASASGPGAASELRLAGHDAPEAVARGQALRITLFWRPPP